MALLNSTPKSWNPLRPILRSLLINEDYTDCFIVPLSHVITRKQNNGGNNRGGNHS